MSLRTTQQHVSVLAPGSGKLRTTQQHVEVLAPGSGKLRITNQYAEVLRTLNLKEVSSDIGISHQVDYFSIFGISSDIGISQAVVESSIRSFSFDSNINIAQAQFESPFEVDIEHSLSLTQLAYIPQTSEKSITHNIDVDHSVSETLIPDVYSVESNISLIHYADTPTKGRSPESSLSMTQTAVGTRNTQLEPSIVSDINISHEITRGGTFYEYTYSSLTYVDWEYQNIYDGNGNIIGVQTVLVQKGLRHSVDLVDYYVTFDDGHYINLQDHVSYLKIPFGGTSKSATSTLSLSQVIYFGIGFDSTLSLSQTATGLSSTGADGTELEISQTVGYSISGTRTPSQSIDISQGVGFFIVQDDFCDYEIFIGDADTTGLPSEPSEPTITPTTQISLAFPHDTPSTTLYFDRPEWGNIHEIYHKRINRKSRGNKRIIYHNSSWREHEIIKITLTNLTETQLENLLDFLYDATAKRIKYIDHESREWTVVVLNPDEQIVRDKVGNTISIEMETI